MKLVFLVQGSAAEPYAVAIERIGDNLTATCDCPAGLVGQYCKHRFRLFLGSAEGVVGGDADRVAEVPGMLRGTDVEAALASVERADRDAEMAKRRLSDAKRALARAMSN